MQSILQKLGFRKNWIYEVIATTHHGNTVNSAPIGVWTADFHLLRFRLYKKSKTFSNLLKAGKLVVNFPEDVKVFHDALASKKLEYIKTVKGLHAISGLNFLELKIEGKKDLKDSVEFNASIIGSKISKDIRLFNRAEHLVLEYLIKKTKPKTGDRELSEIRRIVNQISPKSLYCELVEK